MSFFFAFYYVLECSVVSMHIDVVKLSFVLIECHPCVGEDPYQFMAAPNANVFDLRDFLKSGKRLEPPENCPTGM